MGQDRGLCEGQFKSFECSQLLWAPDPWGLLPSESSEWCDCFREVDDKVSVEVGKADEGLDLFDICGHWPVRNGFGLCDVHRDTCGRNHKTKELNRLGVEQGFLWFDMEVVFLESCEDPSDVVMVFIDQVRKD